MVEQDFVNEKKSAVREFEDHKIYLRDHLISELEEKQKMIETERHNMELTGDSFDLKPISTRKLRRRANEPTGKLEQFYVTWTIYVSWTILCEYIQNLNNGHAGIH